MKKLFILSGVVGLLMTSCSLDKEPYDSMTNESIENTEGAIEALHLGNYHTLKGWVENWHRVTEYPGDNVSLSGTTTDNLFYNYNYKRVVNNARVNSYWENSYRVIAGTNLLLQKLKEGESDEVDQMIAENLYLRSLMYFYLANVFGKPYTQDPQSLAVPIKLSDDPFEILPRNTVKEVYDQLEKDLLKAEGMFNTYKSNVYGNVYAAQALLARVYLFKGDNQKAIQYANKVIESGKFSLLAGSDYNKLTVSTPEENRENIFAIKFVKDIDYPDDGWSTIGSMYANIQGSGWGEMYASRSYLEEVRKYPEDVRYRMIQPVVEKANELHAYYVTDDYKYASVQVTQAGTDYSYTEAGAKKNLIKESNGAGAYQYYIQIAGKKRTVLIDRKLANRNGYLKYYVMKCSGQEGQAHLWSPIISRLAEVYLIRAEASAKVGDITSALKDVNMIRQRAGISTAGLWTAANLNGKTALDVVLEERKLELAWEGHRKFDVFRNGKLMDRKYPGTHTSGTSPILTIDAKSNQAIEFIPEQQIVLSNGVLKQNP
ncbi:membrane protein [Sphingobacterium mizutaii NBRC 14946 = DSM 11724]|uniref:SusD family n=2 Tax=Sphingobacterium mizutaii TaxID=1010 RepID=A0AAJ4X8W0_9SPHI|nr:RagB/SusD family nutrient uptake outer membrane protein [Sphingobacterium mizutaii]GEM67718.1 membrane protein [Sphingobacterium mizutaii NBRC 14946 = DSM 11724]SDL70527.1 SusD family protein [Sphingobacterium mizutaii]SNV41810.1 SusD family [Sphingobacterium mizutaii]